MKVGDLVMIREGFHSLANHNDPPPNGKIAIIQILVCKPKSFELPAEEGTYS